MIRLCVCCKMGCGGSTTRERSDSKGSAWSEGRKNSIRKMSLFRRQKVSIKIQNSVRVLNSKPRLIFIFGGPGSKKGSLMEDVALVYGLKILNVENVILEQLAKRLENPDKSKLTSEINHLIKTEPEILRLDWVLRILMKKLDEMDPNECYLVDFMPNLKFLITVSSFVKDPQHEFRMFEEKYPVSFCVNFAMPSDKPKKVEPVVPKPSAAGSPGKEPAAPVQSDEADSGRTQKRAALYLSAAKPFLDHFTKSERVVTVDVSSGMSDLIWCRVSDFFSDLEFPRLKNVNTVILFGFTSSEVDDMNVGQYDMVKVILQNIAEDPHAPVESLITSLCKHVDQYGPGTHAFAVDLSGTSFTKDCMKKREKRSILFVDQEDFDMKRYVASLSTGGTTQPVTLKAISSSENEVCLFPADTQPDLCKWVAAVIKSCRD